MRRSSSQFGGVDGLTINQLNSPETRKQLRDICRQVRANSPYATGICNTFADDIVGTGPTVRMQTDSNDFNDFVEQEFTNWSEEIGLAEKLKLWAMGIFDSGEGLGIVFDNPKLRSRVQLDIKEIDCERLSSSVFDFSKDSLSDGIKYDSLGKPVSYSISNSSDDLFEKEKFETYDSDRVIHWFFPTMPGQQRGVPLMHPVVELFQNLQDYRRAVLQAAQNAANISLTVTRDLSEDGGNPFNASDATEADQEPIEFDFGSVLELPTGAKASQLKAEQPTSSHAEFQKTILKEIGRCLSMTSNVVMGDSSDHNFASGRLDWQTAIVTVNVRRKDCERRVLDVIFRLWLDEALLIPGYIPSEMMPNDVTRHDWMWDTKEPDDPVKAAKSQEMKLKNKTTTYSHEFGKVNKDWRKEFTQHKIEQELADVLGISLNEIDTRITEEIPQGQA